MMFYIFGLVVTELWVGLMPPPFLGVTETLAQTRRVLAPITPK
jgi:hypothetical protein